MITIQSSQFLDYSADGVTVCTNTYFGLSGDSKPVGPEVGNGSAFVEMDSSSIFFFDAENRLWKEWVR